MNRSYGALFFHLAERNWDYFFPVLHCDEAELVVFHGRQETQDGR